MYDVIGDIHGYADELHALLEKLGYTRSSTSGHYAHPTRKAFFVGDFIDRGPQIAEVLRTVRPMIEAGSARTVMGNHEFNAIAYHTRDPRDPNTHLRPQTEKNTEQHEATLAQLTTSELEDAIDWFRTLPMSAELEGLRVVHACWDPNAITELERACAEHGGVTTAFMTAATDETTKLFRAVEDVLKGKEVALPKGSSFRDKGGHRRTRVRIKWYEDPRGRTFKDLAFRELDSIPDEPIPEADAARATPVRPDDPPVLFGHYWLKADRPTRRTPNVACVDYSVALAGALCAYRWDGEQELSDEKFEWVAARPGVE